MLRSQKKTESGGDATGSTEHRCPGRLALTEPELDQSPNVPTMLQKVQRTYEPTEQSYKMQLAAGCRRVYKT